MKRMHPDHVFFLCRLGVAKLMEVAKQETNQATLDLGFMFDIRRYDTNFLPDMITLLKPKRAEGANLLNNSSR